MTENEPCLYSLLQILQQIILLGNTAWNFSGNIEDIHGNCFEFFWTETNFKYYKNLASPQKIN